MATLTLNPKLSERNGGFEGYLATWYTLDDAGDILLPGCFDEFIDEFLRDNHISSPGHKSETPIGKYVEAKSDDTGFWVRAVFSDIPAAQEVRKLVNQEIIQFLSVGLRMLSGGYEYVTTAQAKAIQARAGYSPTVEEQDIFQRLRVIRVVRRAKPYEGTPTTIPANKRARIMAYKEETPNRVTNYLDRIRTTAASIKNAEAKTGQPDPRLEAIRSGLELVTKEISGMISGDQPEQSAEQAAPAADCGTQARLKLSLLLAKMRGHR